MTASPISERKPTILLVDDEVIVRESLGDWFRDDGYKVDTAESGRQALRMAAEGHYDLALIDIKMPNMDGLELQKRLTEASPDLTIIIMTAYASVETAVQALKEGAYDYIVKPFDPDELSHLVERAHHHRSLESENIRLRESLEAVAAAAPIIGDSPPMLRVMELVDNVAPSDATVLVTGESGTGKELVARAIHARSPRRYNPMVEVHCGALAEGILESELFGHEKGAFTGAQYHHKGKFEQADGGTIFLDEIGEVPPKVQVELLRVLEEKTVTRVGGSSPIAADFRVVAATNRDLRAAAEKGEFRDDLFWRLNVVSIEMPPLRDRPGDVETLADHFLERFCRSMNRRAMEFDDEALAALRRYPWPGNVRELQNAIERAVVLGKPPRIGVGDLPLYVAQTERALVQGRSLANVERAHIGMVLEETDWNITKAARILEVDRGTLYNKIKRYDLMRPGMQSEPGASRITGVRVGAIGSFPLPLARELVALLSRRIGIPCRLAEQSLPVKVPMLQGRGQADADRLLERIEAQAQGDGEILVGLTLTDIGHPIFTHFFGRARHDGDGVLVSVARLTPTFYGMAEDREILSLRTTLEIVHELGHIAGLPHCRDHGCLMHFAPSVEAIDNRGASFCEACHALVAPHLNLRSWR